MNYICITVLNLGCKRLILIGDQNQLPATIFSKKCEKYNYNQSLFERLQKLGFPLYVLKVYIKIIRNYFRKKDFLIR